MIKRDGIKRLSTVSFLILFYGVSGDVFWIKVVCLDLSFCGGYSGFGFVVFGFMVNLYFRKVWKFFASIV